MKISGTIAEFNPFHNGHKYLLSKIKENSDAVICVMSGSFVQRGDVSIFDKWLRAEAALLNGADLIIELPVVYASSAAERFAFGAVELLSMLGCVDELWFGSENGDIQALKNAGSFLHNENEQISGQIKINLSRGMSYPASRQKAYEATIPKDLLTNPNNILAVEYIKALENLKSGIKPVTLKREGVGYHDTKTVDVFASASALRKLISDAQDYFKFVPENTKSLYKASELYNFSKLNDTILYLLRTIPCDKLCETGGVSEGLENKIKALAKKYDDIEKIIENASGKRYTKTRIRRILTLLLLGIDKKIIFEHNSYIRVLGFNDTGRDILKTIKKSSELPIIIKTADFKKKDPLFLKDILSTDIASLCAAAPEKRTGGRDFTTPPVYMKSK